MTNNLPPENNRIFASGENGVIKTERQLLIEAEKKIGEMEKERRIGIDHIEKMKWQIAQLRMGVASLATHFGQTPEQVKEIYDKYCEEQDKLLGDEVRKTTEEAKAKFKADLAAGKVPEGFKVISREDDPAADTVAKPEDN